MVTIYDLAKYCGVSSSTVSKVLNNYPTIPLETKEKVEKAIKELGYLPNAGARSLSIGKSNTIGILSYYDEEVSPFSHLLSTQILDSFQRIMGQEHYELVFISKLVGDKNESFLKNCISRKIDGLILFGNMSLKEIREILESDFPAVAFDYFGGTKTGVTSKNFELSHGLTNLVLAYGHSRICYIVPDDDSYVVNERLEGFKAALKEHNFPLENIMFKDGKYSDRKNAKKVTYEILESGFNPTCIMYPDDYAALAGVRVLTKKGLSIPNDISVTGFDGLDIFEDIYPRLTGVKQNIKKIGEVLARELVEQIKNHDYKPKLIKIDGEIILGDSLKNLNEEKN